MNKTIAFDYTFNYFGGDMYNGRIVTGASVTLAIRCYKDGAEVKFFDQIEPYVEIYGISSIFHRKEFLCSVFEVSFNRKNIFKINRNPYIDSLFKLVYGYDKIKYDIVGYSFDVAEGLLKNIVPTNGLPKEFQDTLVCEPISITEDAFRTFISSHLEDFDISDNEKAQCPSISFID